MSNKASVRCLQGFVLFAAVVLTTSAAFAQGTPEKLDPVLRARSQQLTGRSRVIVRFREAPDTRVITGHGGIALRELPSAGAHVAELDNRMLAMVAGSAQVASISIDRPIFPTLDRTGRAVGATLARREFGVTGKGIGVAVVDSGIAAWHDDLNLARGRSQAAQTVVHFRDFTTNRRKRFFGADQPSDDFGHGTHVAGIIAGNGFDSGGARTGLAPGARLIGLKVLDAQGLGHISDVIEAIDYAIALRDVYNIRIINLSVASGVFESYTTDPLAQAARRAVDAGIVVVAAAGNLGVDEQDQLQAGGVTSPGNAPWVLTVGASSHEGTQRRSDDIIGRFSSRGPTWIDRGAKPDLVAPGVGIESLSDRYSTLYSTYADYLLDGTRPTAYKPYLSLTGTSMAAPVVAGTVALMLEANPTLTPNAVKAILQYTAEERDDESVLAQGAGLLNTRGAIRMASFFGRPQQGLGAPGDEIEGEWVAWSRHIIWGNNLVADGLPLPGSNAWNRGVTWGAPTTRSGEPVVWGVRANDTIVWSTYYDSDDDTIVWSTARGETIVWSTYYDNDTIVWSTYYDNDDDTIVWSTASRNTIVWSTSYDNDTIVWSTYFDEDTIVWSTGVTGQTLWSAQPADRNRNPRTRN